MCYVYFVHCLNVKDNHVFLFGSQRGRGMKFCSAVSVKEVLKGLSGCF